MTPPAEGGSHFQAKVKVPLDAFKMDFVFSNVQVRRQGGKRCPASQPVFIPTFSPVFTPVQGGDGTYDSRGGYDYHLPIEDSAVKEPSLYVTHISVEMAPIAKVWGIMGEV